jgi:hypothetical protein
MGSMNAIQYYLHSQIVVQLLFIFELELFFYEPKQLQLMRNDPITELELLS